MLKIQHIIHPDNEKWDRIWSGCDYATYFHSREWAEIWAKYTKGSIKPASELVIFTDKKEALIPFSVQKRKGMSKTYYLTAEGQYGNWISIDEIQDEHASLLIKHIDQHCKNLVWRLNPYDPINPVVRLNNLYELEEDGNHAVSLTQGFENILSNCHHGHRCSYRKGIKEGLELKLAEGIDEWKAYYCTYEDTVRRWGDKVLSFYDWQLFKIIFDLASKYIKLWIVLYKGDVISGALCFYAEKHVVCWHASVLENYLSKRPMNFMFLEIMKNHCFDKYKWFDFNTSAHIEGLKTFKGRFGAKSLSCHVCYKKSKPIKAYIKFKNFLKKKDKKLKMS
ncbi:MAG TPA: GNAT family N-acetyltransferase [Syntrophorhabdaceae bacterium]|nr:GNAT family N-acetyltransferase [Syntrophorhabdaceae bacterium]